MSIETATAIAASATTIARTGTTIRGTIVKTRRIAVICRSAAANTVISPGRAGGIRTIIGSGVITIMMMTTGADYRFFGFTTVPRPWPLGLPNPVHASHPARALYPPLFPDVISRRLPVAAA